MWPHFCHVKDIPSVIFRFRGIHDLNINIPSRIIPVFDCLIHVLDEEVRVLASNLGGFFAGKILHPCSCLNVDFDIFE